MRNVKELKNIKGKTVLVRVDFNLPIKNRVIGDDFRIKKALPTINFLRKKGAKLILITHLGKGGTSLDIVAKDLNKFIEVKFVPDILGAKAQSAVKNMKNGDVILLENLRNEKGEQESSNNFAKTLAKFGDIYVNEAFPVSHRKDASIVLLPRHLPSYAGLQFEKEVRNLSHAFKISKHPFLFILGGVKFSTKIPLISKYLKLADYVFIGGALANDFLKAKGYQVGKSLVDDNNYEIKNFIKNKKLILPVDVVVKSGGKLIIRGESEVREEESIVDIGVQTVENLERLIKKSQFILWNGPLGKYEDGGDVSTKKILKLVASSKAESILGGGDTVALISEMKNEKDFSFVSTGGGAMLDFLATGSLPGVEAIKKNKF